MPGIAEIADELLPMIFRRRRPLSPRQPIIGNDLPEQGGFGGNMLAPTQEPTLKPAPPVYQSLQPAPKPTLAEQAISQAVPADQPQRPNVLTATPAAAPAPDPVVSPSGQVMDEYSTRPARRVEMDTRGRPSRNITLQGDEQTLDYANRVSRYEPQEGGGGWWPKIRAAIGGFAAGGPVGAAAAFGTRALREKFEPKLADQEWKRQQMGQVAPAVESIRQTRKDELGEESTRANIGLAKARTEALKNPRQNARIIERKDGVYMLNAKTNKFERVEEIPAETGAPNSARYFKAGNGEVWKVDAANPEGVRVKNIPGAPGKDSEDVGFHNQQLNQAIKEAQAEQKKIDDNMPGIPMTIEATDILSGTKKMVSNPEYTYNMTRRRQLDDQIRRWKTQLKSPKKGASKAGSEDDPADLLDDDEEP